MNYYNENDASAIAWLMELMRVGAIPDGHIDTRSIADVRSEDLVGFDQCHFFAGIGGWSHALEIAGYANAKGLWTGSCPCQPFSAAGKRKEPPMPGTSGPKCSDSSASVSLSTSLANKLKQRFASGGSMEYSETWKPKVTPQGRSYWAHTASGRRISDSGSTGVEPVEGWSSPRANKWGFPDSHGSHEMPVGWNTPRATDGANGGPNQAGGALPCDAGKVVAGWATPTSRDHKDTGNLENVEINCLLGRQVSLSPAPTERPAGLALNPEFSRWLMGFPAAWGSCGAMAMQSCRKSRRSL